MPNTNSLPPAMSSTPSPSAEVLQIIADIRKMSSATYKPSMHLLQSTWSILSHHGAAEGQGRARREVRQ